MDQGLKPSTYKVYDADALPEAEIYNQPDGNWQGDAVAGVPLYPEETPGNPRLGRFVVQGYKDLWAAAIFVGTLIMTIIWGTVNFATYTPLSVDPNSNERMTIDMGNINGSLVMLLLVVCFLSILGACGSLLLLGKFPRQLIFIANVLTAVISLTAAVVAFIAGGIIIGIMLVAMCVLQALWLYLVRDRILFSSELLKASSDILTHYKAVFLCSFLMTLGSAVYVMFWGIMAFPVVDRVNADAESMGDRLLLMFFLFLFFWTSQVVSNVMHVTTAGVTATWYFAGEGRMPKNPTVTSFKRASTTSLGSICFGSLVVAIIRLLRTLAESARNNENDFISCITACFLSCLESAVEYFNTYAFVHVAVYGCGYIEAAKRTWDLCKQCFFAAYFNDALISSTLSLLSLGVSALIGIVVGFVYLSYAVGAVAFLSSMVVHMLFFCAVESTVTTLFVCFAEVPEGLRHSSPELYTTLQHADRNGTNNNAALP